MGLWRVLGGLPERFGVLRETCGACFEDHLGLRMGPRRFRFYRALFVSVEGGRRRMLGDGKWNKLVELQPSDGSGLSSTSARTSSSRRSSWLAAPFPGVHLELSEEFCCCRLRTSSRCPLQRGSCLSSVQLRSFGGGALGSAAGGRRPLESADPRGPACGGDGGGEKQRLS